MNSGIVGLTNVGNTNEGDDMSGNIELADRLEIAELFARLARLLDEGRHEDVRLVYAEDVVVRSPRGGELHGIDEVIAFLRRSAVDGEHTQHVNGDVLLNLDGDRVEASANQLVHYYRTGEPPHRRSGLRLAYTVVRTPAGWRFREGRLTLAWVQGS
jgi:SnoaL-like domain